MDVYEVPEHEVIDIPIERLIKGGEFSIDKRIETKGYLNVSLSKGRLQLQSTRFVGLIPLTENASVRVKPKTEISRLGNMITRSGSVPTIVEGFSRGYRPLFSESASAVELYCRSLIRMVERVCEKGRLKGYVRLANPPKWRGRISLSQTINRFTARGIKYDGVFDFKTLSHDIPENLAIKSALREVHTFARKNADPKYRSVRSDAHRLLNEFNDVADPHRGELRNIVASIPRLIRNLPINGRHYLEPLWTSYAILQGVVPDIQKQGYVNLDSMIVDVSEVFEGFIRNVMREHTFGTALQVLDGNKAANQLSFFADTPQFKVKPDVILKKNGETVAIFDAKYKPNVNERDRYELLAFMEASGVKNAAFICPKVSSSDTSHLMGTTKSGMKIALIRFDMNAHELEKEEQNLRKAVLNVAEGHFEF